MKVKTGPSKPKSFSKKPQSGAIQKKKFSKPTGGVLKNIVKITDAFEELKSGKDPIGISCSKEPKAVKKQAAKDSEKANKADGKATKNPFGAKKGSKKPVVAPIPKKPKKETADGVSKVSMKSKILESCKPVDEDNPKLDIDKVNFKHVRISTFPIKLYM